MGPAVKVRNHCDNIYIFCRQCKAYCSYLYILDLLFFSTAEPVEEYRTVPASIAERYKVGRTLGDGNFAVVRECVERSTGREYALKIISKDKCKGKVSPLRLPNSIITSPSLVLSRRYFLCTILSSVDAPSFILYISSSANSFRNK